MIGSEYCFDMRTAPSVVEELNLSSEQRKMILGTTAAKPLKFNVDAAA
jgi:hypothetical protein